MKALILHGWWGDGNENWFPYLKNQLQKKNIDFSAPKLPNSNTPKLEEQLDVLEEYNNYFSDGKWYIIAHSLGCKLALHFVEKYKLFDIKIILVAPVYPWVAEDCWKQVFEDAYDDIKTYFDAPVAFENMSNTIHIITSDNDPFLQLEKVKKYYNQFKNTTIKILPEKWHINASAGVLELPEILPFI